MNKKSIKKLIFLLFPIVIFSVTNKFNFVIFDVDIEYIFFPILLSLQGLTIIIFLVLSFKNKEKIDNYTGYLIKKSNSFLIWFTLLPFIAIPYNDLLRGLGGDMTSMLNLILFGLKAYLLQPWLIADAFVSNLPYFLMVFSFYLLVKYINIKIDKFGIKL